MHFFPLHFSPLHLLNVNTIESPIITILATTTMVSQASPNSAEGAAAPAFSEDECHAELVFRFSFLSRLRLFKW